VKVIKINAPNAVQLTEIDKPKIRRDEVTRFIMGDRVAVREDYASKESSPVICFTTAINSFSSPLS
jgi:hypothetical protein